MQMTLGLINFGAKITPDREQTCTSGSMLAVTWYNWLFISLSVQRQTQKHTSVTQLGQAGISDTILKIDVNACYGTSARQTSNPRH